MEIRVLQYFLAVAREENITRAAELLHITQPTLSRQLAMLEEEVGATLFVRGKRRTTLTPEGQLLRRRAEQIVELAELAQNELQETEVTGVINIGTAETAAAGVWAELMKRFCPQNPHVTFNIVSGSGDLIRYKLERDLVDIALMIEPVNLTSYDFVRLPHRERFGVLMREDSPLAQKEGVTARDLEGLPLAVPKRLEETAPLQGWFGRSLKKLDIVVTYNLIANAAMLVCHGLTYTLAIESMAMLYQQNRVVFRPLLPEVETTAVLCWKKDQHFAPATERFLQKVKQLTRQY